jgi:ATP-dependent Clp protease adaptor protein ClpS
MESTPETHHDMNIYGSHFRLSQQRTTMMAPRPVNNNEAYEDGLAVKVKTKSKKPSMYKVLLLNDDFTPMEFVVYVLERVFRRTREEATDIMLKVHSDGVGIAGVYTYEVAETKVDQVMTLARKNEHPLQCTMEREE